jgi:hypothetical protein
MRLDTQLVVERVQLTVAASRNTRSESRNPELGAKAVRPNAAALPKSQDDVT